MIFGLQGLVWQNFDVLCLLHTGAGIRMGRDTKEVCGRAGTHVVARHPRPSLPLPVCLPFSPVSTFYSKFVTLLAIPNRKHYTLKKAKYGIIPVRGEDKWVSEDIHAKNLGGICDACQQYITNNSLLSVSWTKAPHHLVAFRSLLIKCRDSSSLCWTCRGLWCLMVGTEFGLSNGMGLESPVPMYHEFDFGYI